MRKIHTYRIYDDHIPEGYRVLIDRLWPRGITKERANLDSWWKEIAPESELRRWFNHDKNKWDEFRLKYFDELRSKNKIIKGYMAEVNQKDLLLLYAAKEQKYNHALILKEYLKQEKFH